MKAVIILLVIMLTSPLFLGTAQALEVRADDLTMEVKQGQVAIFHVEGNPNETLVVHATSATRNVPLGKVRLDENGTAVLRLAMVGDMATVGRWQLIVANGTSFAKAEYEVDWDPVYLLRLEGENIARQEALWARMESFALWFAAGLVAAWLLIRLSYAGKQVRRGLRWIGRQMERVQNLASITEMGLQVDGTVVTNHSALYETRAMRRRLDRLLEEATERVQDLHAKREEALRVEGIYRKRILAQNPDDPLVRDYSGPGGDTELAEAARGIFGGKGDG